MSVSQAGSSLWLSAWSNEAKLGKSEDKYMRLGVYTALGLIQYGFMLFGEIFYIKMLMNSSKVLHGSMLESVLKSKMKFFESTPLGRIINRFSKDIEAVENVIPISFKTFTKTFFSIIITIILISISTPFFLIPLVPIAVVYIFCQVCLFLILSGVSFSNFIFFSKRYYVSAVRQLRRLNLASQSPIFSHFGETLTGVTTIRAYDAQDRFKKDMESKINDNLTFYYPDNLSNR